MGKMCGFLPGSWCSGFAVAIVTVLGMAMRLPGFGEGGD
jgi:hypothetical protein